MSERPPPSSDVSSRVGRRAALTLGGLVAVLVSSIGGYVLAAPKSGAALPAASNGAVSISGTASNSGWMIMFHLPPKSRDVAYRMPDDRDFEELGTSTWTTIPFDRLRGASVIEVRYTEESGRRRGPTKLTFDPRSEAVASVKKNLTLVSEWIAFRPIAELDPASAGSYVYFTTLLVYKFAIAEIRYSVDDDSLDRSVRFTPSDRPGISDGDEMFITLPKKPGFVALKVVFADGTESAVRRFAPTSAGIGATMLPKNAL